MKPVTRTLKADLSWPGPPADDLAAALDREWNGDAGRRVFLRANRNVAYGQVMAPMDDLPGVG